MHRQSSTNLHSKVEYLKDLRVGEEKHDDASELGEGDAGEDGGAHMDDGVVRASNARALGRNGKGTCDVGTELDGNANCHHQIHLNGDKFILDHPVFFAHRSFPTVRQEEKAKHDLI